MALSRESKAIVEAMADILPSPLHQLGVEGARRHADERSAHVPPGPSVGSTEDHLIKGPGGPIPVRIFWPEGKDTSVPLPMLVYIHGGGWTLCNIDIVDANCRRFCVKAGIAVVAVGYRLAPEHKFPAAVEDVCFALDWLCDQSVSLGIDPDRIAVGGESAGANLAAVVAIHGRDTGKKLKFQLLAYPPSEAPGNRPSRIEHASGPMVTAADMDWFVDQYLRSEADKIDPRFAITQAADLDGLAPAFVITAECDTLRDEAEYYADLMARAGVKVTKKCYPGVFHGFFGLSGIIPQADEAVDDAVRLMCAAFSISAESDSANEINS